MREMSFINLFKSAGLVLALALSMAAMPAQAEKDANNNGKPPCDGLCPIDGTNHENHEAHMKDPNHDHAAHHIDMTGKPEEAMAHDENCPMHSKKQ